MTDGTNTPAPKSHAEALAVKEYLRLRLTPRRTDLDYPHLKDLANLLRQAAPTVQGMVFDYGCGGAPYRSLFQHCRGYVGADIEANAAVDRVLRPDGSTGEADASYDTVLSTQVLEHICQPADYLRECHRILRPGGHLLLTTHGLIEEHGCPYDFHRWTSAGLEDAIRATGFRIVESRKVTTQFRAFAQLCNQMSRHYRCPDRPFLHFLLSVGRKLYGWIGAPCFNWFADRFPNQASVPAADPASFYVCVYVRAEKV